MVGGTEVALGDGWRWLPCESGRRIDIAQVCTELALARGLSPEHQAVVCSYLAWFAELAQASGWEHVQVLLTGTVADPVVAFFVHHDVELTEPRDELPIEQLMELAVADQPEQVVDPVLDLCTIGGRQAVRAQTFTRLHDGPRESVWEVVTYVVPSPEHGRAAVMHGLAQSIVQGDDLGDRYDAIAATLTPRREAT
jgi:hypothetical protein